MCIRARRKGRLELRNADSLVALMWITWGCPKSVFCPLSAVFGLCGPAFIIIFKGSGSTHGDVGLSPQIPLGNSWE